MATGLLTLDRTIVIAHRGGGKLRPENTMAAFDHAASLGVDGLECDVQLSRDGEVVVIHDPTVDRTTDGTGAVSALTAAELDRLDAGHRFDEPHGFPFRGKVGGVPRLADLLARHADLPVVIEMKGSDVSLVAQVVAVIRRASAEPRVVLASFSDELLVEARRLVPGIPTSASSAEARRAATRATFGLRLRSPAYAVMQVPLRLKGREVLRPRMVRAARASDIPVQAWIVDEPADMRRIMTWGVTGLITDRPDLALAVRGE